MSRPAKRRKTQPLPEEIKFDPEARHDYLTGFHKRKQQRIKHAQEEAAKKERAFKIEHRKQMREQRDKELKAHVESVNALLKKAQDGEDSETDQKSEKSLDETPHDVKRDASSDGGENADAAYEDEYVDEDKYTTVTVEPMDMAGSEEDEDSHRKAGGNAGHGEIRGTEPGPGNQKEKRTWTKENPNKAKPKKKRNKFRYESKVERKAERFKQSSKKSAAARARREANQK